jgi:hypothetical protein
MRKTSAFGIALLLLGTAGPLLGADSIRIGSLCLDWPDGFTNERFGDALLLKGPAEERVVVSYLRGRNDFSKEERGRFARMHHIFATRTLPDAAAGHGLVVQPLTTIRLANGTMIYSTASQAQHAATEYYYLQYMIVGPFSAALFKVQGYGDVISQKSRFDALFASARWNEVAVTSHVR